MAPCCSIIRGPPRGFSSLLHVSSNKAPYLASHLFAKELQARDGFIKKILILFFRLCRLIPVKAAVNIAHIRQISNSL